MALRVSTSPAPAKMGPIQLFFFEFSVLQGWLLSGATFSKVDFMFGKSEVHISGSLEIQG